MALRDEAAVGGLNYKNAMRLVATDRHRGRKYECPICGRRFWTVWGHAEKHWLAKVEKMQAQRREGERPEGAGGP